ncbi:hypothetical protein [Enterobacter kobei]|uniref:hypothetical protein n=1 Tax=Enterobacter kobei TaxID=208224 RepID=UPI002FD65760
MYFLERKDAEKLLQKVLKSTLKKQSDINLLLDIAVNHESGIPMKGIIYEYDKMEKNKPTKQNLDDLNTLMHFYGP